MPRRACALLCSRSCSARRRDPREGDAVMADMVLSEIVLAFNRWVIYYFALLNGVYLVLFLVSLVEVVRFVKRTFFSDYEQILKSDMTWPVSILVPARNESRTIV